MTKFMDKLLRFTPFLSRLMLTVYMVIAIWRAASIGSEWEWYLCIVLGLFLIDGVVIVIVRKGKEWKRIYIGVVLYLIVVIPSIWSIELSLYENRRRMLPDEGADYTWVLGLEQLAPCALLLSRWMQPKGNLSREELSNVLMVLLGTAADILEFMDVMNYDDVKYDKVLLMTTLGVWSWALVRFSLAPPGGNDAKSDPDDQLTIAPSTSGMEISKDNKNGSKQSKSDNKTANSSETGSKNEKCENENLNAPKGKTETPDLLKGASTTSDSKTTKPVEKGVSNITSEGKGVSNKTSEGKCVSNKKSEGKDVSNKTSERKGDTNKTSEGKSDGNKTSEGKVNKDNTQSTTTKHDDKGDNKKTSETKANNDNKQTTAQDKQEPRDKTPKDAKSKSHDEIVHLETLGDNERDGTHEKKMDDKKVVSGKQSRETDISEDKKKIKSITFDLISLLSDIIFQEGPFFIFRMFIIFGHGIITQMNLFFTAKNLLMLMLQTNRIAVLVSELKSLKRHTPSVDTKV